MLNGDGRGELSLGEVTARCLLAFQRGRDLPVLIQWRQVSPTRLVGTVACAISPWM